jgi:hypothetical protein
MAVYARPLTDQGQTKAVDRIMDVLPLHWTVEAMLCNRSHPRFHLVPSPMCAARNDTLRG